MCRRRIPQSKPPLVVMLYLYRLGVGGLGTSAAARGTATASVLAREVAPSIALSTGAVSVEATTSTSGSTTTARSVVATSVSGGLGAAWLNHDVLAVNDVGVGRDSRLVTLDRLVLHESTVLSQSC